MRRTCMAVITGLAISAVAAWAQPPEGGPGPGSHMGMGMHNPCMGKPMMAEHSQKRQELMTEFQDILLQTIRILKEEAKNPKAKKSAEELEARMNAAIKKHQEMHEEMMQMMKERQDMRKQRKGGMAAPGQKEAPANPCAR